MSDPQMIKEIMEAVSIPVRSWTGGVEGRRADEGTFDPGHGQEPHRTHGRVPDPPGDRRRLH